MQYLNMRKAIGLVTAMVFFIGGTQTALAVGTASGTNITNTATVDYEVGGDARSASGSDTGFVVDNRVDLTVTNTDGASISVTPGSTDEVLTYTVTNTGNTAQGYQLDYEPLAPSVMTNVRIYVDDPVGGTPGSWDASDPQYIVGTTGNFANLFPGGEFAVGATTTAGLDHDNGVGGRTSVTVFIVADTSAGATNGQTEDFNLLATTLDSGTDTVTTESAPTAAAVEAVFADGAGTYTGDAANDGRHSDTGTYAVSSAALSVSKTITGTTDEFGTGYAIPGAAVTYQIRVTNTGAASVDADTVIVTDPIPANTKVCVDLACGGAPSFTDGATSSGLTAAAFEYSTVASPNECDAGSFTGYSPTADADGADASVTCIRQAPTGSMNGSSAYFDIDLNVVIQ
jgi:uncharacterized repeat protein (TIGR01451 family)